MQSKIPIHYLFFNSQTSNLSHVLPAIRVIRDDKPHCFQHILVRYIQLHFMNPISRSTACEFFNVSSSCLSHTLQTELGKSFLDLLNQTRIENVCRCLKNNQTINEAAELSGFQSPSYMARVFKNIMNCTPSQYRNRVSTNNIPREQTE